MFGGCLYLHELKLVFSYPLSLVRFHSGRVLYIWWLFAYTQIETYSYHSTTKLYSYLVHLVVVCIYKDWNTLSIPNWNCIPIQYICWLFVFTRKETYLFHSRTKLYAYWVHLVVVCIHTNLKAYSFNSRTKLDSYPLKQYYQPKENLDYICALEGDSGMMSCGGLPRFEKDGKRCNNSWELYSNKTGVNGSCINWNQYYSVCKAGDKNPFQGAISFDNIGLAWVAIFQVGLTASADGEISADIAIYAPEREFIKGNSFKGISPKEFLKWNSSKLQGISSREFLQWNSSEGIPPREFLQGNSSKGIPPREFLQGNSSK